MADLPSAWNEKYQHYLGITPPSDADGVLQDVHWSAGLIGYFPTYALGNLYAAQFFRQANEDLGDLSASFRRGEFSSLLGWLREKIHRHGRRYSPAELVERVTGAPLQHEPLITQLSQKYGGDLRPVNRLLALVARPIPLPTSCREVDRIAGMPNAARALADSKGI